MTIKRFLVDIGNSSAKWTSDRACPPGSVARCDRSPEVLCSELVKESLAGSELWLSSVAGADYDASLDNALREAGALMVRFLETPASFLGLTGSYAQPASMGVDRWLAMLAAWCDEQQSVAVIDAGTALTVDIVDREGRHIGGYIIPGVDLMEQSLLRDTQRVRFDPGADPDTRPGTSTADCVNAGVWTAAAGAVSWILDRYPVERTVITGGTGEALSRLGIAAEFRPHLVLEGLALTANHGND